jgi:hypothetical protein
MNLIKVQTNRENPFMSYKFPDLALMELNIKQAICNCMFTEIQNLSHLNISITRKATMQKYKM